MKTRSLVKKHLSESMRSRNDDSFLRLQIWTDFGFHLNKHQLKIYETLPADGAISRRRREFRSEFPESDSVREKRYKLFGKIRDEYSKFRFFKRRFHDS